MATFLVAGGFVYGTGATLTEAKRNFSRHGGRLSTGYGIYEFDDITEFVGIDRMGRFHYNGNSPTLTEVAAKPRKVTIPAKRY